MMGLLFLLGTKFSDNAGALLMQCVILAGGLGTRIRSLYPTIPKAMIPVAGWPFIHWQLKWLKEQGSSSIVLSVGYRAETIREFVGDGSAWGLKVRYVLEDPEDLRGTGGALRLAAEQGVLEDVIAVFYGDSLLNVSLRTVLAAFEDRRAVAMMTVLRNKNRWEASNAQVSTRKVIRYTKEDPDRVGFEFVDYGLSCLQVHVIQEFVPPEGYCDIGKIYGRLASHGLLDAYEVVERFYEIGSSKGLRELKDYLTGSDSSL